MGKGNRNRRDNRRHHNDGGRDFGQSERRERQQGIRLDQALGIPGRHTDECLQKIIDVRQAKTVFLEAKKKYTEAISAKNDVGSKCGRCQALDEIKAKEQARQAADGAAKTTA